jgi:hypothetical protein
MGKAEKTYTLSQSMWLRDTKDIHTMLPDTTFPKLRDSGEKEKNKSTEYVTRVKADLRNKSTSIFVLLRKRS